MVYDGSDIRIQHDADVVHRQNFGYNDDLEKVGVSHSVRVLYPDTSG